jgi:hypothetical protein
MSSMSYVVREDSSTTHMILVILVHKDDAAGTLFTVPFHTKYFHFFCQSYAGKINKNCIKCSV